MQGSFLFKTIVRSSFSYLLFCQKKREKLSPIPQNFSTTEVRSTGQEVT